MTHPVDLVLDAKARLGEGPIWHARAGVLYWLDIENGEVHVFDPATGNDRMVNVGQQVGTIVPRARGGVMLAAAKGFASLDLATGALAIVANPEPGTGNRFNDGKCDPAGRFWAGTIGKTGSANVYRLDADLRSHRMIEGITCSNGIAWSLDRRTMYYIDTPVSAVVAYDYDDATGAIANKRVAVAIPKEHGYPDGMTMDAEGMLWIGMWDGGAVKRWDPGTGRLLDAIQLPADRVTACAFGGAKLDTLYITTAWTGLADAERARQPLAGGLFRCTPGVTGLPAPEFAG